MIVTPYILSQLLFGLLAFFLSILYRWISTFAIIK